MMDDPDSQSPDLGPPPVSRFDNEEPISFNTSQPTDEPLEEPAEDGEPALSVNLETRRKRRESGPKLNIRRVSVFESPPENAEEGAAKTAKAGAKRKFSVQEDEDKQTPKPDAFRFSRRTTPATETEGSNEDGRPSSPARPVLASSKLGYDYLMVSGLIIVEPVNTDPVVSPKKQRQNVQEKPEKKDILASKPRGRARLNISRTITPPELPILPMPMPEPILTAEINLDALPPKTPAVQDIFSPPSTEPSTSRPESKDTPPPGDLSAAEGRPGRRARPQVSYKEPSLHTKMRRPDAKLVDAIVDRRTSVEPPPTSSKPTIKRETAEDLGWRPVSAIAGRDRGEEAETGSPLREKLDRRESEESKTSPAVDAKVSTASKAIEALISETSAANAKRKSLVALETQVKQEQPDKDMAIFDFTDSSPADTAANPRTRITELAKAARNARRHSAVPAPASIQLEDRKTEGALPVVHKRTGSGNVKSSSTTSLGRSTSGTRLTTGVVGVKEAVKEREKKILSLPQSSSSIDLKAKAGVEGKESDRAVSALRAERAASRRKSMML
jgi:hypothetical protein